MRAPVLDLCAVANVALLAELALEFGDWRPGDRRVRPPSGMKHGELRGLEIERETVKRLDRPYGAVGAVAYALVGSVRRTRDVSLGGNLMPGALNPSC